MRTVTTRTIFGRVRTDGTIVSGSGFSSRKLATGSYVVNFGAQRLLGFVLTNDITAGSQSGAMFLAINSFNYSEVGVYSWNSSTVSTDAGFQFIAQVAA